MKKLEQAIILNGPGRSGTTLLYQMLAYHEELGWISSWNNAFPNIPTLAVANFLYRGKRLGLNWHNVRLVPKPVEGYKYWESYFPFFSDFDPVLSGQVLEEKVLEKIKCNLTVALKAQRANRFLTKITGLPRKDIFDAIFNDYTVVWIERDPRVVVSSILKQKWFYKNKQPAYDRLTEAERILFYADYYKKLFQHSGQYANKVVVKYEDLVADQAYFFEGLCQTLNLSYSNKFRQIVKSWPMEKVDWEHYKHKYSEQGIELLQTLLAPEMRALGYQ